MTPNEYLKKVLEDQALTDDELADLLSRRDDVKSLLLSKFSESAPSIRWAGSRAKGTMIRESYDADTTCYFVHDEEDSGKTLEDLHKSVREALAEDYFVEAKPSALRVKDKSPESFGQDFHIDVVPGRFIDDTKSDVNLHQNNINKQSLKTNLQVHIDHIKGSGVTDAIRLMKLWKVRNGLSAKTFVLELLVVKLLSKKKAAGIATQLEHILTEFRDHPDSLAVKDPANESGNDLKPLLDECRSQLSMVADSTLSLIENSGWESVFGKVEDDDETVTEALKAAAVQVHTPTKPWAPKQ